MNDPLVITAIRRLPPRYATPGVNVTRFGNSGVVAAHPEHPALVYREGRWKPLGMGHVVHRKGAK